MVCNSVLYVFSEIIVIDVPVSNVTVIVVTLIFKVTRY